MENSNITTIKFRGRSDHTLDIKGRLNLPGRLKETLALYESDELMVTCWGAHLRAYPVSQWEILENTLLTNGREQPGLSQFIDLVVGAVTPCFPDKQGRVLIPPSLRDEVGIVKDVMLLGVIDHVKIWDKDAWVRDNQATRDNFGVFQESLTRLGIF
jgi:MraZ protein